MLEKGRLSQTESEEEDPEVDLKKRGRKKGNGKAGNFPKL
jgi:hypothetical protein